MDVRLLNPDEWALLEPIYRANGGKMPQPESATASVAIDGFGLCGFWSAYMITHAGPLWIRDDHRGTGLWRPLHAVLETGFTQKPGEGYFSFSEEPKVETIFTKLGYKPVPYKVWKREF